ncbi:MAG: response regulator [Candidatus Omnitrophica bacterium]|nr:response regulator [Candidatus Omnitrophota bacterium]
MKNIKIAIVEDEEGARKSIVRILNLKGYNHILEASRGKEAIAMIEKEKPDLVFLDIKLADEVSGMEVLERSRTVSPATRVIMMSAYQEEHAQQSKELGAYGFFKKPMTSIEPFIKTIQEIAEKLS